MSRTMIKNGNVVYDAARIIALNKQGANWLYFTVGEVAKQCGKSKQTVRKYLKLMCEERICRLVVGHEMPQTHLYKWTQTII